MVRPMAAVLVIRPGNRRTPSPISGLPSAYIGRIHACGLRSPWAGCTPPGRSITVEMGKVCNNVSASPLTRNGMSLLRGLALAPEMYRNRPCGLRPAKARATCRVRSTVTRRYSSAAVPTGGAPAQ